MRTAYIYKLCCKDTTITDIYVGSSFDINTRKVSHKTRSGNSNFKVYNFIRDNGGWENWDMEIIEEYSCKNEVEKNKRERYWYDKLQPSLNMILPFRTIEEELEYKKENHKIWYKNNKVRKKEISKIWYEKNIDKIKARKSEQILCECGRYITRHGKARHLKTKIHNELMEELKN